jgi:hypothetical protein
MADQRGPTPGPPLLWDRLTTAVVVGVLGYACLLVVRGSVPAAMFDRLGFGMTASGIVDAPARRHVLLVYGILGAVLIGWMVLLLAVVLGPLRRRERWAWNAVTLSMTLWFLVDTTFSLAVGSSAHAVFNVPFAAAIGVPLAALRIRWPAAHLPQLSQEPETPTDSFLAGS